MEATSNNRKELLFQLWLKGEVNQEQELELWQLAADDPFLAEAMEGYESLPEADHLGAIAQLKSAVLQEEEKAPRILPIQYFSRIAAALLILVSLIWLWNSYQPFSTPDTTNEIALEELPPSPSSTSPVVASEVEEKEFEETTQSLTDTEKSTAASEDITAALEQPQAFPIEAPELERTTSNSAPPASPIIQAPSSPAKPQDEELAKITPVEDKEPEIIAEAAASAVPERKVKEEADASYAEDAFFDTDLPANSPAEITVLEEISTEDPRIIQGTVKGDFEEALSGVVIVEIGTKNGTISDQNGHFKLKLKDDKSKFLEFNYTGFQSRLVEIDKADGVDVILDNAEELLDQVTVAESRRRQSSVKKRKARDVVQKENSQYAAPIEGFQAYEKYIRKNKKYPAAARKNKIKGIVKLSFTIDKKGTPANIKILQSLGYGCDEEAMRLLREGPKWMRVVKEVREFTYEIRFDR